MAKLLIPTAVIVQERLVLLPLLNFPFVFQLVDAFNIRCYATFSYFTLRYLLYCTYCITPCGINYFMIALHSIELSLHSFWCKLLCTTSLLVQLGVHLQIRYPLAWSVSLLMLWPHLALVILWHRPPIICWLTLAAYIILI